MTLSAEDSSDYDLVKDYILHMNVFQNFTDKNLGAIENKLIKPMLNLLEKKSSSLINGVILNK